MKLQCGDVPNFRVVKETWIKIASNEQPNLIWGEAVFDYLEKLFYVVKRNSWWNKNLKKKSFIFLQLNIPFPLPSRKMQTKKNNGGD